MPLPADFELGAHLLSVIKELHNQKVDDYIVRPPDENGDIDSTPIPEGDLTDPLSNLKLACKITDDDSASMACLRCFLFYNIVQQSTFNAVLDKNENFYYIPVDTYQAIVTYQPQIILWFRQKTVSTGYLKAVEARISFRLSGFTNETIKPTDIQPYITRLNNVMYPENEDIFNFNKGSLKFNYADRANGIDFRLLCLDEKNAVKVIKALLAIINDKLEYSEEKLITSVSKANFQDDPTAKQTIYNKERKKIRKRPSVIVHFWKAELSIWGIPQNIIIADARKKEKFVPKLEI